MGWRIIFLATVKKERIFKRLLKRKKLLAVILVLIVVGIVVVRNISKKEAFETTEVKKGTVREELILSGEVKAVEHARLIFQTSGKISWVGVSEGAEIKKGQALMRLDTTNLYQDLLIADTNLRSTAAALNSVYDDLKDKKNSETFEEISTRTTAEATKDAAVFSHIKAQQNLTNATLYAPFTGIVTYIAYPFTGANVLLSETQVEVVNPDTIFFEVSGDQSEVIDLFEGQKVTVILDSFQDKELVGEIEFISLVPYSGEVGTVYKIKVKFTEGLDKAKLRVGMSGDARIVLSERNDVFYVPPQFIKTDSEGKYLMLENNKKAHVEVGLEGEDTVEIMGEITEGDKVYD